MFDRMEPFRSEEMDWGVGRRHGYIYSHSPIIILLPCAFQLVMLGQGFARCSFSSMARRVGVRTSARDSRPCTPPRDGGFDHLHQGGGHRQIMQCLSFLLGQEERVQGHTGPPQTTTDGRSLPHLGIKAAKSSNPPARRSGKVASSQVVDPPAGPFSLRYESRGPLGRRPHGFLPPFSTERELRCEPDSTESPTRA